MTSTRVSVQDIDAVKARLREILDLIEKLPTQEEISKTFGAENSMAVIGFRMDLVNRASGLASLVETLRGRTKDNLKEIENTVNGLLETDAHVEAEARKLSGLVEGHRGAAGPHTHRVVRGQPSNRIGG